jgi:hypothetical protein
MNKSNWLVAIPTGKLILLAFALVFAIHFGIKSFGLRNYNIYPGKIIGFEKMDAKYQTSRKLGGKERSCYLVRIIPKMKYFDGNDSIIYTEGRRTIVSYFITDESRIFRKGENIHVIVEKKNPEKVRPLTFFHYWLYDYELITICLFSLLLFGYCRMYINKKSRT